MKNQQRLILALSLFSLTACSAVGGGSAKTRLDGPPVVGSSHFKTSQDPLALWLSSPQISAWIGEEGITAEQAEARTQAARILTEHASLKDSVVHILGDVDLSHSAITTLPDNLIISGTLNMSRSALHTLDIRLSVGGDLNIEHTQVVAPGSRVRVGRDLKASNSSVRILTSPLSVGRNLELNYTPISSLPDALVVQGNLELRGAPLAQLPPGLKVLQTLDITLCPITTLPNDLKVTGNVSAAGTRISHMLPQSLLERSSEARRTARSIDLRNTDLSYDLQAQLRVQEQQDTVLLFGDRFDRGPRPAPEFAVFLLDDFIAAFRSQLPQNSDYQAISIADWRLNSLQQDRVHSLLQHLHQVPGAAAGPLAERVLNLFVKMQKEPGIRQDVLVAIGQVGCTTGTQAVRQLEEAELTALTADMGNRAASLEEVETIGIRMLHLRTLHHEANAAADRYSIADVRQAELTFESQLRQSLLLPLNPRIPTGPMCSQITEEDVVQAAHAALEASRDPSSWGPFLASFAPYQRYVRTQAAAQAQFAAFPEYTSERPGDEQSICPLTQAALRDIQEPVVVQTSNDVESVDHVFELAAFLQYWSQTGTHPLTQNPVSLGDIRRIITPE